MNSQLATQERRIALLIDGDNAQGSLIDLVLGEINKFGVVSIRRIYGDWTKSGMKGWKNALQRPFEVQKGQTGHSGWYENLGENTG